MRGLHFPQAKRIDLRAEFESLSPQGRLTALVCGIVSPLPYEAAELARILRQADLKVDGRRLTVAVVGDACQELIKSGLLSAARSTSTFAAVPRWAPWLTMEALRRDLLERIWRASQQVPSPVYSYSWNRPSAREVAELRYATVTGRWDLIPNPVTPQHWVFLNEPGAAELLASLPGQHRDSALSGCLHEVIHHAAAAPDPLVAACRELAADLGKFAADIALIRILQGRLEDAETIFGELAPGRRASPAIRVDLAGVRALVATLRGDDGRALRSIEEALTAQRAGTGRRYFPASLPFAFSLFSLVRLDTPPARALLAQLLSPGSHVALESSIVGTVAGAAELRAGRKPAVQIQCPPGLEALLFGWTYGWASPAKPHLHPAARRVFGNYVDRLAAHGFFWALAECLAIIGHAGAELDVRGGSSFQAAGKQGAAMHRRLGTQTLATLVPEVVPAWEFPLKALEQFAYETGNRAPPPVKRAAADDAGIRGRLVWDLAQDGGQITVSPREQRASRSGRWSKGRPRSLDWLATAAVTADYLHVQDRAAAAQIQARRHVYGTSQHALARAVLFELAGHPLVFNAAGDVVEVVHGELELVMEQQGGVVTARIIPDDRQDDQVVARMVGARRCEVVSLTPAHRRLHKIIPAGGLKLPAAARPRLLEAVSALVPVVRIHGGVEGSARSARRIEADSQPRARLVPLVEGVSAELVVEPVAGSEIYFAPGAGSTLVFGQRAGETVQAQRDLAAERAAADRLAAACPLLGTGDSTGNGTGDGPGDDTGDARGDDTGNGKGDGKGDGNGNGNGNGNAVARGNGDGGPWSAALPDPGRALELLEQLEAAGVPCLWPKGERFKLKRAEARQLRLRIKSAGEWLSASGELRIDQQRVLDLKQLFALLDADPHGRFLELGAGEFLALTDSFRRQLDDLRSLSSPAARGALRLHAMAAIALDEFVEQTELDADREWRALQQRLRAAQEYIPEVPSTLQAELRPYQRVGFDWLARLSRWGVGACLADDMGLGKTVQVLALLLERAAAGPALVVAPTSVVANWLDEARRFAPTLNPLVYVGSARATMLAEPGPFDLFITTYTLLQRDAERLGKVTWHTAVLDEAQAIKNPVTKRARAARKLDARFRLVTTGTPVQNDVMDLYSLFSFINPGLLGSADQFRRNFAAAIDGGADDAARTRLRRLLAPFILRRLKTEVLSELPPRTEITLQVEMSPAEADFYEALRRRAMEDLDALAARGPAVEEGRMRILAHLMRLRRACCNPALVHAGAAPPSSKLTIFAETLAELLANRHKVLVFSQFVGHLQLIEAYLKEAGVSYQYLDGSTSATARRVRIAAFQAGQGDVFLISLTAGGVGLNLTAADYVIHMDPWWNPAVEDQASDRAHRIGQTRPVTIYRLVTKGTIEEQIVDLHQRKRDLAERLLEAGDAHARLDAAELLELLRQPLV